MSTFVQNPFTGAIGEEYEMLRLICPGFVELADKLGLYVAGWRAGELLRGFEIGCGTGVSTLAMLARRSDLELLAVDSSPKMLAQAKSNLAAFATEGRATFIEADALEALRSQESGSLDLIASNYATHNFDQDYRQNVLAEAFRALKAGGLLINGDRFAIDDVGAHVAHTQGELRHWFKTFAKLNRYDLLEEWVVHLFSDEFPERIMYFSPALRQLQTVGFAPIRVEWRSGVDTLVAAFKPPEG